MLPRQPSVLHGVQAANCAHDGDAYRPLKSHRWSDSETPSQAFWLFRLPNVQRVVVHYLGGAYGKLVRTMKGGIVLTSSRIRRFACIPLWKHLACPALRSAARAGASLPLHRGAASCFIRERHRWLLLTSGRLEIRDYTLYDPSESVVQSPPGFAVCRHSNLVPPVLLANNNVPAELGHIPGYSQRRVWCLARP